MIDWVILWQSLMDRLLIDCLSRSLISLSIDWLTDRRLIVKISCFELKINWLIDWIWYEWLRFIYMFHAVVTPDIWKWDLLHTIYTLASNWLLLCSRERTLDYGWLIRVSGDITLGFYWWMKWSGSIWNHWYTRWNRIQRNHHISSKEYGITLIKSKDLSIHCKT